MSGNRKKCLYVGGLDETATQEIVFAAFIPFGDIKEVNLPKDFEVDKHKGFAFVEFEETEDAAAAMDNMEGAEICGKVIRCSYAKPMTQTSGGNKAVWTNEEWLANAQGEEEVKFLSFYRIKSYYDHIISYRIIVSHHDQMVLYSIISYHIMTIPYHIIP